MATAEELITENIDLWTGAIKRKSGVGRGKGSSKKVNFHGITLLKRLILKLAIQGKLTEQGSSDFSVREILNDPEIIARKITKGKGVKVDLSRELSEEEKGFKIPSNWEWTRLGKIVEVTGGSQPPKAVFINEPLEGYTRLIQIRDFKSDKFLTFVPNEHANRPVIETDIMIGRYGPPVFQILRGKSGTYNVALMKAEPVAKSLSKNYLFYLLSEPGIQDLVVSESERTAGQSGVRKELIYNYPVALPPLEEQHRIVAKVDELIALCDQLEQQTEANISAHQTLVETLLQAITRSDSSANSAESIELLFANFDSLFTTEDSVDQLKQTILQLAVMGKLVPQDPSDEPASVLLEKIAAEKEKLVKEKKIKKQKALPLIASEEIPFELPVGWCFERVGNLVEKLGSGSTPRGGKGAYVEKGIPFLRSQNIWNEGLSLDDVAYIPEDIHKKMDNTKVLPNDVLLNITGASLGRTTIFPETLIEANVSQHVTIIRLLNLEMAKFVHLGILSPMVQKLVWGRQVGMAIEGLSKKVLEVFEFPVPPLAEQRRIVARVEKLFILCDKLKIQLNSSQSTRLHLADAVTEQAIA